MFLDKEFLKFIEDSKNRGLDIVKVSVVETQGHCYAKPDNMILVNSKDEFTGVLGAPCLHEEIIALAQKSLQTQESISFENTPKNKESGHGTSRFVIQPYFYHENYSSLLDTFSEIYSVLIFGSGAHVSSLISIANIMGWKTTVVDMKMRQAYVDEADELIKLDKLENILTMDLSSYNASVILSHSPKTDDTYLQALLNSNVGYIGILGNKKNMEKKKEQFKLQNDKRFFAPVGFDIGGITHQSIALSICSQIEARKNGKI